MPQPLSARRAPTDFAQRVTIVSNAAQGLVAKFSWAMPSIAVDGISVLVNDVERARLFFSDSASVDATSFEWERTADLQLNEYLRFGYVKGGQALDYTAAGTLFGNGSWSGP